MVRSATGSGLTAPCAIPHGGRIAVAAHVAYRSALFPALAPLDAERVHEAALAMLACASHSRAVCLVLERLFAYQHPALGLCRMGLQFVNPLGLAAGCDKNGVAVPALAALGFGHVEVGTVTPVAQPGNSRPRVWRLPADHALINAMGFPSAGAERTALHLARWRRRGRGVPVGVNLGKNVNTPIDRAWEDYVRALDALYPYGDYFVANISSPNTVDLRDLHAEALLVELGRALADRIRALAPPGLAPKPLLLKVSPDLTPDQLDGTLAAARRGGWQGLVVGNTTVGRAGLRGPNRRQAGGVSGGPLFPRTLELVRTLRRAIPRDWVLIGVGGVMNGGDAWRLLRAGADLVQAYTGFVYGGPAFAGLVNRALVARLAARGCRSIDEAIGTAP